jgi:hypothetical protein
MIYNNKSQISFEYILIFVIILLISVPSIFLFRTYIYESSDKIIIEKVDKVANELITTATEIYYRGAPSRIVIELEMPKQIKNISIVEVGNAKEFFLVFNITTTEGELELFYESDIPINRSGVPIVQNGCFGSSENCNLYYFNENETSPGLKNFKIEAKGGKVQIEGI